MASGRRRSVGLGLLLCLFCLLFVLLAAPTLFVDGAHGDKKAASAASSKDQDAPPKKPYRAPSRAPADDEEEDKPVDWNPFSYTPAEKPDYKKVNPNDPKDVYSGWYDLTEQHKRVSDGLEKNGFGKTFFSELKTRAQNVEICDGSSDIDPVETVREVAKKLEELKREEQGDNRMLWKRMLRPGMGAVPVRGAAQAASNAMKGPLGVAANSAANRFLTAGSGRSPLHANSPGKLRHFATDSSSSSSGSEFNYLAKLKDTQNWDFSGKAKDKAAERLFLGSNGDSADDSTSSGDESSDSSEESTSSGRSSSSSSSKGRNPPPPPPPPPPPVDPDFGGPNPKSIVKAMKATPQTAEGLINVKGLLTKCLMWALKNAGKTALRAFKQKMKRLDGELARYRQFLAKYAGAEKNPKLGRPPSRKPSFVAPSRRPVYDEEGNLAGYEDDDSAAAAAAPAASVDDDDTPTITELDITHILDTIRFLEIGLLQSFYQIPPPGRAHRPFENPCIFWFHDKLKQTDFKGMPEAGEAGARELVVASAIEHQHAAAHLNDLCFVCWLQPIMEQYGWEKAPFDMPKKLKPQNCRSGSVGDVVQKLPNKLGRGKSRNPADADLR